MQLLAILRAVPGATPAAFAPLMQAEEQRVWSLYVGETLRTMHWSGDPRAPETIRVVFALETASTEEAEAALATLPMVRAGLLNVELIPLSPWRPLEILFAQPVNMPHASPEQIARRFYAIVEIGDAGALPDVLAPEWEEVPAAYPGQTPGPAGYRPVLEGFHAAFPDGRFAIEEVLRARDRVVVRTRFQGTHRGTFLGREATGKRIVFATIDIHQIRDGLIRRSWHLEDFAAAMAQMDR